ncbi:response regulator transcription factor [Amycolatopsis sp. OK19-0408]|uniref:Response regulator transcription factor n=1 Tax=Amycolatopsis iheyensis TaxID=2945988 RepID=A0A9X2SLE4_9PSEU|nr:response regulator transcription factor [Amycolatopsis iheyensis]MCR6484465.1 response regulator transcription factor [Amycolatopsis iheyensis]
MAKVLVVEDTDSIREVVELALDDACFDVRTAADGDGALAELRAWDPDVVVLDLNIPGPDGLEVCRRLRGFSQAYVVMLTAKSDEVDKLVGLASGADDYLTKPFSPRELVARIQAMLRRPRALGVPDSGRVIGPVRVDVEARDVTVSGEHVELTRIEFELLSALTENVRAVSGRDALRRRAWGESWLADDHAVDVHVSNLRRKLAAAGAPGFIATVRGVGYRVDRGVR